MLVFATPKFCTSAQCGPTLDRIKPIAAAHPGHDLHQRGALPAGVGRRSAPAGPDRRPPQLTHAGRGRRRVAASRPSRGCSSSTATGSSPGRSCSSSATRSSRRPSPPSSRHQARAPSARLRRAALRRRVVHADGEERPALDPVPDHGPARRSPGARRGDRAGTPATFSRAASVEHPGASPPVRPKREPADVAESRRVDPDDDALGRPSCPAGHAAVAGSRGAGPTQQQGRPTGECDDDDQGEREHVPGAAIHPPPPARQAPAAGAPVPVLPGASSGSPAAHRGHVVGPGS